MPKLNSCGRSIVTTLVLLIPIYIASCGKNETIAANPSIEQFDAFTSRFVPAYAAESKSFSDAFAVGLGQPNGKTDMDCRVVSTDIVRTNSLVNPVVGVIEFEEIRFLRLNRIADHEKYRDGGVCELKYHHHYEFAFNGKKWNIVKQLVKLTYQYASPIFRRNVDDDLLVRKYNSNKSDFATRAEDAAQR